jgi:membrane-associated phospholipid phosphatase
MIFSDILSLSTIFLYIIPVMLYGITHESYHKRAFIGMLMTNAISECAKHIFIKDASPRPYGATNCDVLCTNGNQEGRPGMPSSHSAIVAFFAVFYVQHVTNPWIRAMIIFYAILVMMSRYHKRCHTIPQIIVGGLVGCGMSIIIK